MLRSANNRAFSASELLWAMAAARATVFHGVDVVVVQKIATAVCSDVRVLLFAAPTDLTSFYVSGVSRTGHRERTWYRDLIAAFEHEGYHRAPLCESGRSHVGGVDCQESGDVPGVYGTFAVAPSLTCAATVFSADSLPTAMPSLFAGPSGILLSDSASAVSSADCWTGNSLMRVSCAAVAAAASIDAPSCALLSIA